MRWIIIIVLVLAVALMLLRPPPNAGDRTKLDRPFTSAERQTLDTVDVTADQLAQAACTGGAQCWIAVNGVVYDLGSSPAWKNGSHHGVRAGTDATEDFVRSGHGRQILEKLPVVGRYRP